MQPRWPVPAAAHHGSHDRRERIAIAPHGKPFQELAIRETRERPLGEQAMNLAQSLRHDFAIPGYRGRTEQGPVHPLSWAPVRILIHLFPGDRQLQGP